MTAPSRAAATVTKQHDRACMNSRPARARVAFDTSGVAPAADLNLSGRCDLGRRLGHQHPRCRAAKAQASTTTSRKFHQLITATGEYSIEAWVVPGNVTQEDARIVSYSGSTMARNFTHGPAAVQLRILRPQHRDQRRRRAAPVDRRRCRTPAGVVAARRHDVRSGQRPSHLRERRVHRRRGRRGRRHARRLGQQLRVRARQRSEQQPPVAGRGPPGRDPQPRADAAADQAELRSRRRRELLPAVRHLAPRSTCRRRTSCSKSTPVRQLRLSVQQRRSSSASMRRRCRATSR